MVSIVVIQQRVNTAKLYYQTLLDKYRINITSGCSDNIPQDLNLVKWLILALNMDLRDDYNTTKTQSLYDILNSILGAYNTAFTPNSQVIIPNTTYTVNGTSVLPTISITDANFVGNTYSNADLFGFTFAVFDQNVNRYLNYGIEYTYNPTGGIIIVGGIFGGESYRIIDIVRT